MIKFHEKFIINKNGKKNAVILPIEEYDKLLEDIHDLSVIKERKNEDSISFKQLKESI